MSSSTLRIATVGLSEKTENAIKFMLEKAVGDFLHVDFRDGPDCIIFDVDQPAGRAKWQRYVRTSLHKSAASILLSLSGYGEADCKRLQPSCTALRKPARMSQLREALFRIQHGDKQGKRDTTIQTHKPRQDDRPTSRRRDATTEIEPVRESSLFSAAQQLPDRPSAIQFSSRVHFDPSDIDALRAAHYDPEHYFQGFVAHVSAHAKAHGEPMHIATGNGPITLDPRTNLARIHLSKYRFRTLCSIPRDKGQSPPWRTVETIPTDVDSPHLKLSSIDGLLWVAAIWASRGRLPEEIDADLPVHMRHWPNLTRLTAIPHAMNIAALWSRDDLGPIETARRLHIDPRHVFTFASACHALGLLQQNAGKSRRRAASHGESRPHRHRSLLARLLARISPFARGGDE